KVPVRLAHDDEQVVFLRELDRCQAGVHVGEPPRDVSIHQPAKPLMLAVKSGFSLETDEIDVLAFGENVLRLQLAALKRRTAELPRAQHADPERPCRRSGVPRTIGRFGNRHSVRATRRQTYSPRPPPTRHAAASTICARDALPCTAR